MLNSRSEREEPDWLFADCRNPACRFRFPATSAQSNELNCPRCSGPLSFRPAADDNVISPQTAVATTYFGALLDNIRSIHNVGSMFRTADGAGLDHLYLCGITATPDQPRLAKAALGAQESVPWSYHANAIDLADELTAQGHVLWGLERTEKSHTAVTLPSTVSTTHPIVLVVGHEKAGVDPDLLIRCSHIISLPMTGRKGSLNAAVAFGIATYALRFGAPSALDSPADST